MKRWFETRSESGSGAGTQDRLALTKEQVTEIMQEEVVSLFREQFLEMFWSIKTVMVEYFDEWYAVLSKAVAVVATAAIASAEIGVGRAL